MVPGMPGLKWQSCRLRIVVCLVAAYSFVIACGGSPTSPSGTIPGFTLSGDPASPSGATWKYQADAGGVHYDLEGILFKPQGSGPFPAVVISHGLGGNAGGYGAGV